MLSIMREEAQKVERKQKATRWSEEEWAELKREADDAGETVSGFIRRAVVERIARLSTSKEVAKDG
jgi:hypothetical protein